MAGIPITRNLVSEAEAEAIRRSFQSPDLPSDDAEFIRLEDAGALLEFLSDPAIHAPIYTLPSPLTIGSVRAFIEQHIAEQEGGEGLLYVRKNEAGQIIGYTDIQAWPQWGACELGGAIHPDLQGMRSGVDGARNSFDWLFKQMNISLICETAALDNVRTARLLDGLKFRRMGQVKSVKPDGTTRTSLVWEVTRDEWIANWG